MLAVNMRLEECVDASDALLMLMWGSRPLGIPQSLIYLGCQCILLGFKPHRDSLGVPMVL